MQAYSNPKRANDPYSLPDVEVFHVSADEFISSEEDSVFHDMYMQALEDTPDLSEEGKPYDRENQAAQDLAGFYHWACFPGCLPDSDPIGPFESEQDAIKAAQEDSDEESESEDTEVDTDAHYCHICGGEGVLLGSLGMRAYFRCRNCGMDFSG